MSEIDKPVLGEIHPDVTLTIRLIMNGKEVGSIIGKGGEIINDIRDTSGAKIHISDVFIPERIVTITGTADEVFKSFNMICEIFVNDGNSSTPSKPPVSLRLVVPASQCGPLIGKGGSKIKEIREVTGASVQVASDMLPNSTERAVTVSGTKDAITQCIYHICCIMLEYPYRGSTIPYHPKGGGGRGANGSAGNISHPGNGLMGSAMNGRSQENALASLLGLGSGSSALMAIASLASSHLRDHHHPIHKRNGGVTGEERTPQTCEMSIPNDSIGCIIGKGGSKIAEIRHISGAMIRISKSGDESDAKDKERLITITGNVDSVALAKSLINMSLYLHKNSLESPERRDHSTHNGHHHGREPRHGGLSVGLAQLLSKPETLTALTSLASLTSLGGFGGGLLDNLVGGGNVNGNNGALVGQVTGAHHRQRTGGSGGSSSNGSRSRDEERGRESKRSKFAPY